MEEVYTQEMTNHDEEHLFLREVIGDEHELLFLDSYLRDVFGDSAVERIIGVGNMAEEETL